MLLLLLACRTSPPETELDVDQVTTSVRSGPPESRRWAQAVITGLRAAEQPIHRSQVCQVLAVIEQESGYQANPPVPGIAGMVREELAERLRSLGPLQDDALDALLAIRAPDSELTYEQRLEAARNERDLDLLYREVLDHAADTVPVIGSMTQALLPGVLERLNPVTTVGSMQVRVDYALEHRRAADVPRKALRDHLYTLEGGVLFGTLRLFDGAQGYDAPIYRFADYNAGPYSSRNAAFQRQLQTITGQPVTADGDLLVYNDRGRPRADQNGETVRVLTDWAQTLEPPLPRSRILADLEHEKSARFERTDTWGAVRTAFAEKMGREPAYAIVPDVALDSPKLQGAWSTSTFANRVDRRYRDCLER